MGKATKVRSTMPRAVREADIPGAQLRTGAFEAVTVPNPLGEVEVAGKLRQHVVARRVPPIVTLHRRRVIDRGQLAALEWYYDRLALAQLGLVKCALGGNGGGGGSAASHVPVTEAMLVAAQDVAWARAMIAAGSHPEQRLRALDAVLVGEESFVEAARREVAGRYVRHSVRHRQRQLRDLFVAAAKDLARAWHDRFGPTPGRVRSAEWRDPAAEEAWRAVEAAIYGGEG